jgi:hypothetical protein
LWSRSAQENGGAGPWNQGERSGWRICGSKPSMLMGEAQDTGEHARRVLGPAPHHAVRAIIGAGISC